MEEKNNIIIRFTKSSKRISLSELAKIITEGKYIEKWVTYHRARTSVTGKTDKRLSEIPLAQPNSEEDYNGLVCLVIKGKNDEVLEHLASQLATDNHTRLCAINTFLHQIVLITCYALDNDDAPYPTAPIMVRMFRRFPALCIEHLRFISQHAMPYFGIHWMVILLAQAICSILTMGRESAIVCYFVVFGLYLVVCTGIILGTTKFGINNNRSGSVYEK